MSAAIYTVWFEDTDERREVVAACRGCKLTEADLRERPFTYVVSPAGVAHLANVYGDTDCGHDATCDRWWWPL